MEHYRDYALLSCPLVNIISDAGIDMTSEAGGEVKIRPRLARDLISTDLLLRMAVEEYLCQGRCHSPKRLFLTRIQSLVYSCTIWLKEQWELR